MKVTTVSAIQNQRLSHAFKEIWRFRGLIWAFSLRDLKVKYFQTILGPLWLIFTPIITVGVMSFVFGYMVKIPSDNLPYLVFYLASIIPWLTFTSVLNHSTTMLETNAVLFNKIYFPKLIIALSYVVNGLIDFLVGLSLIVSFSIYFGLFNIKIFLALPLLLFIQMAFSLGLGLLLAPYNAQYRDIKHMMPFFIQLFYFTCPIMYSASLVPMWAQGIYKINPMAFVITSYRNILSGISLDKNAAMIGLLVSTFILIMGIHVFIKKERKMVDVL